MLALHIFASKIKLHSLRLHTHQTLLALFNMIPNEECRKKLREAMGRVEDAPGPDIIRID